MSINSITKKIDDPNTSKILLFAGALVSMAWAVYFALVTITIPYQIEYREGTAQVLTSFFLKGENPFTFESQPLTMNNYGLGYNLVVLPFAAMFGNTLLVHRSITFTFILLSAALGFFVVYKKTRENSLALTCAAFITTGLIANGGIGAFPSSLGTFLFLAAIFIPFLRSFDLPSLIVSIIVSLMAFYTKPYFLLSFGIVASYLFLFISKRKSVLYGIIFLAGFIPLALAVNHIFPLYFINTIIGNASNTLRNFNHLFIQLRDLFFFFYPVLFFALIFLFSLLKGNLPASNLRSNGPEKIFNFSKWDAPLFASSFHFLFYSFACSFLAFLIILGPHMGSYMNYAYQLLIPIFFCWFFHEIKFAKSLRYLFVAAVVFNLFIFGQKVMNPDMLKQKDSQEWARLFEYIRSSQTALNSPAITSELVRLGLSPMDSGQTSYFYSVQPFPETPFIETTYEAYYDDGLRYVFSIDRMIKKQRFDLVVITKGKSTFFHSKQLENYYLQVDEIELEMPQTRQNWTMLIFKIRTK